MLTVLDNPEYYQAASSPLTGLAKPPVMPRNTRPPGRGPDNWITEDQAWLGVVSPKVRFHHHYYILS
jgi:hypothetical protein